MALEAGRINSHEPIDTQAAVLATFGPGATAAGGGGREFRLLSKGLLFWLRQWQFRRI